MTAPKTLCRGRADCRLCGRMGLQHVFSLQPTPPANAFVTADKKDEKQQTFPLDLYFCESCYHLQLRDVVDPAVLFENYVYVSGTSPVFIKHFEEYADEITKRFQPAAGGLVVDIGSNDGTLLRFFQKKGNKVLGIDPAKKIAAEASASGVETWPAFFDPALAKKIVAERGPAAVVTANNVFAHADDLKGFAEGVRELLAPDGVFVFEVSYLADVISKTLFDTIYHEHVAYHSLKPLRGFFASRGLELIAAVRVDSHGGSLRGMVQRRGGPRKIEESVAALIREEEAMGLDKAETFREFAKKIGALKERLGDILRKLKMEGKSLVGFGAPAKATTLMHHFGLGPDLIDFIVDDSPWKQGLLSPGLHIPVVPSAELYKREPDAVLVLAWNFADSIIAKHKAYGDAGGKFIVPLPEIRIV